MSPRETLVTLGVAAGVFGLWMIQFENLNVLSLTIVVVFFLMGIPLKAAWAIYLLFATLVFLKFVLTPQFSQTGINEFDLMFTLVAMGFAGFCFRYLELWKYVRAFYPSVGSSSNSNSDSGYSFPSLLGGRWWLIPLAVLAAMVLLWAIPYDPSSNRRYWITPLGARLIFLTCFLFFFWFVCRSTIAFAMRWQMDPEQADIQVRSLIADEFWSEQIPMEARRAKLRRGRDRT